MNTSITKEFNVHGKDVPAGDDVLTLSITADMNGNVKLDGSVSTNEVEMEQIGNIIGAALANLVAERDYVELRVFMESITHEYWNTLVELSREGM